MSLTLAGCSPTQRNSGKLPFGALDFPAESQTIRGIAFSGGWALSEDGLARVAIYLDRTYLQDAILSGRREDVIQLFPQFNGVKDMRWVTELHTESLPIGHHDIWARIISKRGLSQDVVSRRINIEH